MGEQTAVYAECYLDIKIGRRRQSGRALNADITDDPDPGVGFPARQ